MKLNKSKGKSYKYFALLLSSLISYGALFPLCHTHAEPPKKSCRIQDVEKNYLRYKTSGKYQTAMDIVTGWTLRLNDPVLIEANIFRINELIKYQELIEKGISSFNLILNKNKTVKQNTLLRARIQFFLNRLLLSKGKIEDAIAIRDSLGFLNTFKITGPFNNGGKHDFEKSYAPETGFSESGIYPGKVHQVKWFNVSIDLTGKIDLGDLFTDVDDSLFYLYREIDIHESKKYIISFGKTGCADIWLDNMKIFSNRKRHSFNFDQYHMEAFIPAGKHIILVKVGDSRRDGIKFSLRINDKKDDRKNINLDLESTDESGSLIRTTYFNSLNNILLGKPADGYLAFLAGYLFYFSGLNSEEDKESLTYFNLSKNERALNPIANYYQGMIEEDINKKEFYFHESLTSNKNNIESLREIAKIKLDNNFIYEAWAIIESIRNIYPLSVIYTALKAKALISSNFHDEALKIASGLKKSEYPSKAYLIEAEIHKSRKRNKEAAECYKILLKRDKYNRRLLEDIIECDEKSGRYDDIIKIVSGASRLFPNNVWLRLKLSSSILKTQGVRASLPYLASALKISPYNKKALFEIGIAYHKLGRDDLAGYYLNLALSYDPDNFLLKRYLQVISNEKNEIEKYLIKDDPVILAEKAREYIDEPVVELLNEIAINVLSDGSYEKWARRIYMVNDAGVTKDFSREYIVVDPSTNRIENVRCFVINDGDKMEASIAQRVSLSDPQSRLYYDMEAYIIPLPSIKKGSIVDLSYVIKNSGGKIYKNYFGEKIIAGSKYRTIIKNIVVSFPDNKRVYCHLKKIRNDKVEVTTNQKRKIYQIVLENIAPYKKEISMSHPSEILPCAYFISHSSWDDLYRWYLPLLKNRITVSDEMKKSLAKIINVNDSGLEKVRKIYNHVNSEIRYVGFEFGLGGIQPRRADLTYHTKMGDCKDITLVLLAMLKEAGVDAKMSLIRTRDKGNANISVPFLGEFNHAICYVDLGNGFFIDGTAKMSGFKELPSIDRGITAFVLDNNGYNFIKTGDNFTDKNIETTKTDVTILDSGNAELSRTVHKQGVFSSKLRYEMLDYKRQAHRISEYWNKKYAGSTVGDLRINSMSIERPVSYSYRVGIPSFLHMGEEDVIFRAFLIPSGYYRNYCMQKKRMFPLSLSDRWISKVNVIYNLPAGYSIYRIPEDEKFDSNKFTADFKYKYVENSVKVSSIIKFKESRIEVEEYGLFRDYCRFIERKENERIILVRKE